MKRRHAFTLIELLVVLSIIALLITLLLPALSSARRSAQDMQGRNGVRPRFSEGERFQEPYSRQ